MRHALVRAQLRLNHAQVLELFVSRHARAVVVTDEASRPLSVITPTDVLRLMVDENGPKLGDVTLAPPSPGGAGA